MPRNGLGVYSPPPGTAATTRTSINSVSYNLFLSDISDDLNAARPVTAGGTGATTAAAARTNLGILIGTNVQAYDAGLQSIATLGTAADKMLYTTGVDTFAEATITAAGRAILDDANAAAQLVTLGAQPAGATLTSLEGLALVAGDTIYATAADTLARLAKGTAGQGLRMNAAATAPEWGVPTMTPGFESADQSAAPASTHTIAHGLVTRPSLVQVWLKCLTAEHGYAVGDWYGPVGAETFSDGANNGVGIAVNATNIKLVVGSNNIAILNASTGARSVITAANWALVARAWK